MHLSWELFCSLSVFLLFVEGIFAGSEIAILSLDPIWLESQKQRRTYPYVLFFQKHPERLFSVTLLYTALCVIIFATLLTIFLEGSYFSAFLSSFFVIFFGELTPKVFYRKYATTIVFYTAPILFVSFYIAYPITKIIQQYTSRLSRLTFILTKAFSLKYSLKDHLKSLLRDLSQKDAFTSPQKYILKKVLSFQEESTQSALIPVGRMKALSHTATIEQAFEAFSQYKHSILPVYKDSLENIIGLLYLHDIFHLPPSAQSILPYIRPPLYLAELQTLKDALSQMALRHTEMAVVVDEHGHALGILTAEDIMEKILSFEQNSANIKTLSPSLWCIDASISISELNDLLPLEIPHGDYETFGGYLIEQFRRIPQSGDTLIFETTRGTFQCTIQKALPNKIQTVLLKKIH